MFNIPFYISFTQFIDFISTNFPTLVITDGLLFLSYIIINISFLFLLLKLIRLIIDIFYFIKSIF